MAKVQAKVTTTKSSLRAFAKHVRVTENAVRKAVTSGRLKGSIGRDAKGKPFIRDVALAVTEWTQNAGRVGPEASAAPQAAVTQTAVVIPTETLVAAQRSATLERSRKLKLDNDLKEGLLVEVAKASREAFEAARTIRKTVMNIPSRLSAELAAESDAARVYSKLDAALREALNSVADQLLAVGE